jgi:hypothetical protein
VKAEDLASGQVALHGKLASQDAARAGVAHLAPSEAEPGDEAVRARETPLRDTVANTRMPILHASKWSKNIAINLALGLL